MNIEDQKKKKEEEKLNEISFHFIFNDDQKHDLDLETSLAAGNFIRAIFPEAEISEMAEKGSYTKIFIFIGVSFGIGTLVKIGINTKSIKIDSINLIKIEKNIYIQRENASKFLTEALNNKEIPLTKEASCAKLNFIKSIKKQKQEGVLKEFEIQKEKIDIEKLDDAQKKQDEKITASKEFTFDNGVKKLIIKMDKNKKPKIELQECEIQRLLKNEEVKKIVEDLEQEIETQNKTKQKEQEVKQQNKNCKTLFNEEN